MQIDVRVRTATVLVGACLVLMACGRSREAAAVAGPPPEALKPLLIPPSPYYIIYSPPVNLAKPPDTTTHARKSPG